MKIPNLRIVGEETQVKYMENIFNKIIGKAFSNIKKQVSIKIQTEHQIDWTKREILHNT